MRYETVIGLEVHIELLTETKIFCSCPTEFGGEPNTHVCPVCLGLPGTLPTLNKKAVELSVRAGLAAGCEITPISCFDRKNYFYPDLPKAYQISQLYLPLCRNGSVTLDSGKIIRIKEMHMEEDAGKLMHSPDLNRTLIDCNRCGVPLLEIVSEPDMRSAEEAVEYLEKLRELMRFAGVSDCRMQEGSLRADINLSVRPEGEIELGTRTEMKNLNSFRAAERAIKSESARQISLIESGGNIIQETRRWDDGAGMSYAMRSKEDTSDYKYFPEPDIPPVVVSTPDIEKIKNQMPELPQAKRRRWSEEYNLGKADIDTLMSSPFTAELFDRTVMLCKSAKDAASWINVELPAVLRGAGMSIEDAKFSPDSLGRLINMLSSGEINRGTAKKVFAKIVTENADPAEYVRKNGLSLMTDAAAIEDAVKRVIAENEKERLAVQRRQDAGVSVSYRAVYARARRQSPGGSSHGSAQKADINSKGMPLFGSPVLFSALCLDFGEVQSAPAVVIEREHLVVFIIRRGEGYLRARLEACDSYLGDYGHGRGVSLGVDLVCTGDRSADGNAEDIEVARIILESAVLFELDSRVVLRVAPLADDELVNFRSAARKGADDYRDSHNESCQPESLFHW